MRKRDARANARRPLALCQAAPDATSCFLPARGEPREASAAPLCARRGGGGGAASGQRAPEFPVRTWEGWGGRWEREVNAPVGRQTTPGVPAAFCPRGDPAGARAMRLLGARALPDPCPGLRDPRPESNPGLCLFVSEVCRLSGTCPGTRRWPCRAVARHQCNEIKIRLLG